jgi:predicted nucleotidyltransferase
MALIELRDRAAHRLKVHQVVLFGSRARGDADWESDMDVLVVLEDTPTDTVEEYVSDCAWEVSLKHGLVVAPVVVGRDDWYNGPERFSLLAQAIREEGVPL